MLTRQQKQNALARLHAALAAACADGLTLQEVDTAVQNAYRPASAALPPSVLHALRTPTAKASVQIIEAIEADALTALRRWPGHAAARCDLGTGPTRSSDTVYVRDLTRHEFQREVVGKRAFLSATQHNLGVDVVEFVGWNDDSRHAHVRLRQQKVGKTPIGNGTSTKNENRSMPHIIDKMAKAGETVHACFGEEFDATVFIEFCLDTTSPIRQSARDNARQSGLEVNDATELWNHLWPSPVKQALLELYGTEARAKGLGVIL